MVEPGFENAARETSARNLTSNVAAVAATWNAETRHMHIIYYLEGPPADGDEDLRELTVAELLEAYPAIRTASSAFGAVEDLETSDGRRVAFGPG